MLLLDEPFGALDAKVRKELRRWLRRLHDELHVTSIFVTHDQEEAFEVADRVVVMNKGKIEQVGTPQEVYEQPGDRRSSWTSSATSTCSTAAPTTAGSTSAGVARSPEHRGCATRPPWLRAAARDRDRALLAGFEGIGARNRMLVVGPTARLELEREDTGEIVEAEIPGRARARST